jgi:RND family efflux transporter MFP subunit
MHHPVRQIFRLAAPAALSLLLLGVLLGTTSCKRPSGGPPAFPPPAVRTATAVQEDTPVILTAFGTTVERASVDVVPQVSGTLIRSLVEDGAVVTNGQPLFEIDPRDYALRVRQVESQLTANRATRELARSMLARSRELHEKKLVPDEQIDELQARLLAAEAQVQADESLLDQARLNLSRCSISAPLTGICSRRYLDPGNLAAAGGTRLINIRCCDPLTVEFAVSEQHLPAIRQALQTPPVRLEIIPRGETNRYAGTLVFLDNAVSPQTGTILLRGQVPNPDQRLWARQFVEIRLVAATVPGAVMVPEGAVQFGKSGTYLYTVATTNYQQTVTNTPTPAELKAGASPAVFTTNVTAEVATLRIVQTGARYHDRIQIVRGVAPQERVVVLGQLMLRPGATVRDLSQLPAPAATPPAAR